MSHCALSEFGDKWESVLYNDIDPILVKTVSDAMNGRYLPVNFKPEWINRERFKSERESDGFVKYGWSFNNNGRDYFCSKEREPIKRDIFELVVNGVESELTKGIVLGCEDVFERYSQCLKALAARAVDRSTRRVEPLARLYRFMRLAGSDLSKIAFTCADYRDYQYEPGDVVYCDMPYEERGKYTYYGKNFDYGAFYEWAASRPFDVYFTNYTHGKVLWQKSYVMNCHSVNRNRNEVLMVSGGASAHCKE